MPACCTTWGFLMANIVKEVSAIIWLTCSECDISSRTLISSVLSLTIWFLRIVFCSSKLLSCCLYIRLWAIRSSICGYIYSYLPLNCEVSSLIFIVSSLISAFILSYSIISYLSIFSFVSNSLAASCSLWNLSLIACVSHWLLASLLLNTCKLSWIAFSNNKLCDLKTST